MQDKLILLFDSLRDPRDTAQVIHFALSQGIRIELTGSTLSPTHPKVIKIISSWIKEFEEKILLNTVFVYSDFFERITELKKDGYTIIGTTPHNNAKNFFKQDYSTGKHVIVFGTETSGLNKEKQFMMDELVRIPQKVPTSFFTISIITPPIVFEVMRQKKIL